ncbi:hypothetical protein [Mesorhizobium sp. RIZ17]|uniref:hypothetical protein n=1 Tax=Mesorhizobium sp. RIZ17 TaxID=3132743 RepID=UPI003DA7B302
MRPASPKPLCSAIWSSGALLVPTAIRAASSRSRTTDFVAMQLEYPQMHPAQ